MKNSQALKEHDIVVVTRDDVEYISSSVESHKDTFATLPIGTEGIVAGNIQVEDNAGGCYVEFPYIQQNHPDAEAVMWMDLDQFERKGS